MSPRPPKRARLDEDIMDDDELMMLDAEDQDEQEPFDEPEPVTVSADAEHVGSATPAAWRRAECSDLDPATAPLVVMQMDASVASGVDRTPGCRDGAVVQLFGVTKEGHSVLIRVHGFRHYFYVKARPEVSAEDLKAALNRRMSGGMNPDCGEGFVTSVEIVSKRSILYFIPNDPTVDFFKVTIANPRMVRDVAKHLSSGGLEVACPTKENPRATFRMPEMETFDSTLDYLLRFMIEVGLVGCSWLTLPPNKYTLAPKNRKVSLLQLEADVHANDIIAHTPEGEWLKTAPLRRLSFDIECAGRKGVFPEPEHDSVIQIANYIWEHGGSKSKAQVVFTLKSCAPIVGADVSSFDTEQEMLSAWARFVRASDPDILTGYNIVNFDLPYLIERAEKLKVADFPLLGRLIGQKTIMKKTQMSSSAFGTHESRSFSMHGRVIMDMLQVITRDYKLRSYSLNSVSAEFLGQQKEDVHYSIISDLQRGDEQTRRRLAVYCLKDALLPVRLMDKLLSLTNYMEMARVTGIPLGWLVSRGHMIKVVSLLHRKSHLVDLVIPDIKRDARGGKSGEGGPQFEGATVIEPKRGFYTDPIATLDFASLYPSIMMSHNLCYSTLVLPEDLKDMQPDQVSKTPSGAYFVRQEVKKGILSKILEGLLSARKQAKKDLAAAKDPFLKAVLNGRQLALKISANAVYGFTGASVGKLPCMEISASTTAYGRQMIEQTKAEVEKRYKGADVIYGDTDSVLINFGAGTSLAECMRLGQEAADSITKIFPGVIRLEYEKSFSPLLLVSKKRYAGLLWTDEKTSKMDCKGIESVRRDNCRLVANVISSVLELLLQKRNLKGAIAMVKNVISDLLQNKIDVSLLVVSKALSKTDYENKQAHVVLAEKLRKRDPGTAPSLGDRVPYVIIKGTKNEAAYSRAEDPLFVLERNIPIDNNYYLENMLRKPLARIFEPVMKESVNSLFVGEHTRAISVVTPKTGGMMKFAKVRLSCLGCKSPITSGALCKYCMPKEAEVYVKTLDIVTNLEKNFAALWTECQRCMGNVCHDVLCSNGDCPIFYRRRKAQKDLDESTNRLARFELEW